jgi:hypothetical protein
MIGKLEFSLPEESTEFDMASNAGSYAAAIETMSNEIFRPARKHGYQDPYIQILLDEVNEKTEGKGTELVSLLEGLFHGIKSSYDID